MADPATDPAARATRSLGIVTGVLTVVVAINTLVFSCSNDRMTRENVAIERAERNEAFWTDAMSDLGDLIKERPAAILGAAQNASAPKDDVVRWNDRCELLAKRTAARTDPDLSDEKVAAYHEAPPGNNETPRSRDRQWRAMNLELAFARQMRDPDKIGPSCSEAFQVKEREADRARATASEATGEQPAPIASSETIKSIQRQVREPTISLTGASPTGWDIDVFWCESLTDPPAETSHFDEAWALGNALADRAKASQPLVGQPLGRIRVRKLSARTQQLEDYASRGRRVFFDRGNDQEKAMANAIASLIRPAMTPNEQITPSKWYLTAFFCQANSNAAASKAPSPAANSATAD